MEIIETKIPAVKIIRPKRHGDSRGFFSETYNKKLLEKNKIKIDFVQDNHSLSEKKYTLRGLHFQSPPFAQTKLVRVLKGEALDVAVDIRINSPYYGKYVSVILSETNFKQILVPSGFAHGILTLEPNTEIFYKVDNYYSPENDKGVFWNDEDLSIEWLGEIDDVITSDKDKSLPCFKDLEKYFFYEKSD